MNVKAIAITALVTCVTACGGTSSDPTPTLSINSALNSQTLEGIWLIQSKQVGRYSRPAVDTHIESVKSAQQFVVIEEQVDGRYSMPECALDLFSDGQNISLNTENIKNIEIDVSSTRSFSENNEETSRLKLSFEDNLKFTGTIDVVKKDTSPNFESTDERYASISAVKVSDSLNFELAEELSVALNINFNNLAELTLTDLDPAVSCLAVSSANYVGLQLGLNISIDQENVLISNTAGNEVSFQLDTGNMGSEVIRHESYLSTFANVQSAGVPSCAANTEDCALASHLILTQSSSVNGITASTEASNEDDDSLAVNLSVEVKE
ncbi:MAG: hypothetical protein V7765_17835 [Oleispira sp.]